MTNSVLCFLKKSFPSCEKFWSFYDANNTFSRNNFSVADAAAKKAGLQVVGYGIKSSDELKTTLASCAPNPALRFPIADDLFESEPEFIFTAAREKKLPTMFNEEAWAIRGALAAYGPSYVEMGRQDARLVDKIIKGEKPASLPSSERLSSISRSIIERLTSLAFISPRQC